MATFDLNNDYTLADWLGKRISYTPKQRIRFNEAGTKICQALGVKNNPGEVTAVSLDVMNESEFERYTSYLVSALKNRRMLITLPFISSECKLIYCEDEYEKGNKLSVDKYVVMTIAGHVTSVFLYNEGSRI